MSGAQKYDRRPILRLRAMVDRLDNPDSDQLDEGAADEDSLQ